MKRYRKFVSKKVWADLLDCNAINLNVPIVLPVLFKLYTKTIRNPIHEIEISHDQ